MTGHENAADIQIRRATPFDATLFAALHATCFDTDGQPRQQGAWDETAMAQFIAGPSTVCLLATVDAEEPRPAGFLIARAAGDEAELLTIGVVAGFRNRGAGRALLQHAGAVLNEGGVRALFLEVDEANAPALALYQTLGALAVGRRPGYYDNGGDAAILRLDLQT